jgi:hypothetical protein
MKILRSVSQRGFSVGTAGWFTVLRPNTWFPASRLPKSFPNFDSQMQRTEPGALGIGSGPARAGQWSALEHSAEDRNRMRSASAIVGALTITSAMLWWIMHP